jgi:hypothetical protein
MTVQKIIVPIVSRLVATPANPIHQFPSATFGTNYFSTCHSVIESCNEKTGGKMKNVQEWLLLLAPLEEWVRALIVAALSYLIIDLVSRFLTRRITALSKHTTNRVGTVVAAALAGTKSLLILLLAILIGLNTLDSADKVELRLRRPGSSSSVYRSPSGSIARSMPGWKKSSIRIPIRICAIGRPQRPWCSSCVWRSCWWCY